MCTSSLPNLSANSCGLVSQKPTEKVTSCAPPLCQTSQQTAVVWSPKSQQKRSLHVHLLSAKPLSKQLWSGLPKANRKGHFMCTSSLPNLSANSCGLVSQKPTEKV